MQKTVAIIGKGAWGSALYHVVSQNHKKVHFLGREEICTDDIIILAVPTQSLREVGKLLQPKVKRPVIINTSKGIEQQTHQLPREIIKEFFPDCRYFTLIGPGFAGEVTRDMPTIVNLGYGEEKDEAGDIAALFQTDTFRVRTVRAVQILELSAALKNIYAIGCGLADGLGYEINTRTLLTVIAIEEVQKLFSALKLGVGINSVAGTIGDLMLTCNSIESRNFRFGRNLAHYSIKKSLAKVNATVEGYTTLESLAHLEKKSETTLPLAEFIKTCVIEDNPKKLKKSFELFIKNS